jgi:hypothetical protein
MQFRIRLFTLIWIWKTTSRYGIYTENMILKVPLPVAPAEVIRFHTLPDEVALYELVGLLFHCQKKGFSKISQKIQKNIYFSIYQQVSSISTWLCLKSWDWRVEKLTFVVCL